MLFPGPDDKENTKTPKQSAENRFWSRYFLDFGKGADLPGVRYTLWAADNGVTELCDHRFRRQPAESRLASAWFGDGYLAKARALRVAKAEIAAWSN